MISRSNLKLTEFVVGCVIYVFDTADWITTLIVAAEYINNTIDPCTVGDTPSISFPMIGGILIALTIITFILATIDTLLFVQEMFYLKDEEPNPDRIRLHIKLEIVLNLIGDLAVAYITAITAVIVGSISEAMAHSLILNAVVMFMYIIKIWIELRGECGCYETKQAVKDWNHCLKCIFGTQTVLLIFAVSFALAFTDAEGGDKVLIIDGEKHQGAISYGRYEINHPSITQCWIECEEQTQGQLPLSFYDREDAEEWIKCDDDQVSWNIDDTECVCDLVYIPMDGCRDITCSEYTFEMCYGTCVVE